MYSNEFHLAQPILSSARFIEIFAGVETTIVETHRLHQVFDLLAFALADNAQTMHETHFFLFLHTPTRVLQST